jgi:transcriptional regulator with XRE-family HTH domain
LKGKVKLMSNFKAVLQSLRQQAGYSQLELAQKLGLAPSTISMYETGQREPNIETLEAIADFFNVDMNVLIGKGSTTPVPDDDAEVWELRQQLREQPGMRMLFSAAKGVSKEDLEAAADIIRRFKREAEGED